MVLFVYQKCVKRKIIHCAQNSLMAIMEQDQDDEEWYPPSPPIYDVADKLIEINRDHRDDPASEFHMAGRLRWKSDDNLVQIKWLYKNDWETRVPQRQCGYESESDSDENTSSEEDCGSLAVHLSRVNLMPPMGPSSIRMELPTIEDVSPDTSSALQPPPSVVLDYYEAQ